MSFDIQIYKVAVGMGWEWESYSSYGNSHSKSCGKSYGNQVGISVGIQWEFLWESYGSSCGKSCGNSYGNPMENPVGNPVETGWEWELKFHYHGNPANLVLTKFGICLCCLYGVTV